jgi:hypothetical protein
MLKDGLKEQRIPCVDIDIVLDIARAETNHANSLCAFGE